MVYTHGGGEIMNTRLTIGRLAKQAGVNIDTVRYYERRGLLSPDAYRDSGYRLYDPEAARKLRFIKNAQELGFTLKEISGLLRLRVSNRARCRDVKRRAQAKLDDVDNRIQRLESIRRVLRELLRTCHSGRTTNHCPILRSLEDGS
jgi:MerR family mercuric resistance operon transcriptional regulator/MerR family gold-responsive transcriptional activator of gol and ges genes